MQVAVPDAQLEVPAVHSLISKGQSRKIRNEKNERKQENEEGKEEKKIPLQTVPVPAYPS